MNFCQSENFRYPHKHNIEWECVARLRCGIYVTISDDDDNQSFVLRHQKHEAHKGLRYDSSRVVTPIVYTLRVESKRETHLLTVFIVAEETIKRIRVHLYQL